VSYNLQILVVLEVLTTLAVLLVISVRRAVRSMLFQMRRRANMRLGESPVMYGLTAARQVLGRNAWQEFASDAKFLRDNWVTPSELEALKHASFMGSVECKEDMMFILKAIRGDDRPEKQKLLS
jgi:hypothetical protein